MTRIDKACYERGCACYDDRVDGDAVEVVLAQEQEPWCMKMNGCKTKCEDCPDEPPQRTEQAPFAYVNIEKRKLEFTHDYVKWDTPTTVKLERIPLYTEEQLAIKYEQKIQHLEDLITELQEKEE